MGLCRGVAFWVWGLESKLLQVGFVEDLIWFIVWGLFKVLLGVQTLAHVRQMIYLLVLWGSEI